MNKLKKISGGLGISLFVIVLIITTQDAFGETDDGNFEFPNDYFIEYSCHECTVLDMSYDEESKSIIIKVPPTRGGSLSVILPRGLIDAKSGSDDTEFTVLFNGKYAIPKSKPEEYRQSVIEYDWNESEFHLEKYQDSRRLWINYIFTAGTTEIKIIGTHLFGIPHPSHYVSVEINSVKVMANENSNLVMVSANILNNGKKLLEIYPTSEILLLDKEDREFPVSYFTDLTGKGFQVSREQCPLYFSIDINPGLSESASFCFEVPKNQNDFFLKIYSSSQGFCDNYLYSCLMKKQPLTIENLGTSKPSEPKTQEIEEIRTNPTEPKTFSTNQFFIEYPPEWDELDHLYYHSQGKRPTVVFRPNVWNNLYGSSSNYDPNIIVTIDYGSLENFIASEENFLDDLIANERKTCRGIENCSDFSITESSITTLNGMKAFHFSYDNSQPRIHVSVIVIPNQNDLWWIITKSHPSQVDLYKDSFSNSIESFTLQNYVGIIHQEKEKVPNWIKNNAKWWSDGQIGDSDFVSGIQYLIKEGTIGVSSDVKSGEASDGNIPSWVRNNAGWWADGQITEDDFLKGIEFLVKEGIIQIS